VQSVALMYRGALGRASGFVFAVVFLVPFVVLSIPKDARPISVAKALATPAAETVALGPARAREVARSEIVLGIESTPVATAEPAPPATPEPTPVPTPTPSPARTPAPAVAALPQLPDPPTSGVVIASWYGPGFYGNRTACGQVYTPQIIGVAHRTLPCGTMVTIEFRGRTMTTPVIDRGPYIAGRTLDLSNATKIAMACTDLCTVSMRIGP
jgi:rare lipoprotein A